MKRSRLSRRVARMKIWVFGKQKKVKPYLDLAYFGDSHYLKSVKNPLGKKGDAYISQTSGRGFTAFAEKTHRKIGQSMDAEKLAVLTAEKGYRKVTFHD